MRYNSYTGPVWTVSHTKKEYKSILDARKRACQLIKEGYTRINLSIIWYSAVSGKSEPDTIEKFTRATYSDMILVQWSDSYYPEYWANPKSGELYRLSDGKQYKPF